MSEKGVIDLCQSGQLEYFSEIYEMYVDAIYRFVYGKTYDKELSEDIVSNTFLKALEKIHTFKNTQDSNFRAWLYRIAYNQILDTLRKNKEDISLNEVFEMWYQVDFWSELDNKEQLQKVFQYFDTLNARHREILIMRLWDDLSYKEISEILWEKLDNCKKIVSRTLKKVSELYGENIT